MKKGTIRTIAAVTLLIIAIFSLISLIYIREGVIEPSIPRRTKNETIEPPTIERTELENKTHVLINQERQRENLNDLEWNGSLASVARDHSQYLANLEENHGYQQDQEIYISHTGEQGGKHNDRMERAGITHIGISAENVAGISSVKEIDSETREPVSYLNKTQIAERSVEGWMDSPGHRENIMNPEFEQTGIGIATDPENTNYILTQIFTD